MGYWRLNDIGSGAQLASITYAILCDYANQGFNDAESVSGVHNFAVNGDNQDE